MDENITYLVLNEKTPIGRAEVSGPQATSVVLGADRKRRGAEVKGERRWRLPAARGLESSGVWGE